jgi:glycosyltransferase involved in cell wall biosynthesis
MKIGLNGQKILIENPAGPEKYTLNLFQSLAKVDQVNEYIIYLSKKPPEGFFEKLTEKNPNFSYKVLAKEKFWTQFWLAKELIFNPVEVFFSAVHTIPIIKRRKMKVVGMIHGLEYTYSKEYKHPIKRLFLNLPEKYVCGHSDLLVVPSKATKEAILSAGWKTIDANKIHVVHEGVSNRFRHLEDEMTRSVLQRYNLEPGNYLFAISTIQPRKNYTKMIEAFGQVLSENPNFRNMKLAIAGKNGWDFEEILATPKKFHLENSVSFLGRIPDKDVPTLYSEATAYISTSLEEGFGLPLVEAMACGIPTVVSDIPAYREVGGQYPTFVNPQDTGSIKSGIKKLLENPPAESYLAEAVRHAQGFSWESCAAKTIELFKTLM